jgi:flagellar protein FlaJ
MGLYTRTAFKLFSKLAENISDYFAETKTDLKLARIKASLQEYLSTAFFTSFLVFLIGLPFLSLILGYFLKNFLFSFLTALTVSLFSSVLFFYIFLQYPKFIAKDKSKNLEKTLPFASLYLSTISGSRLPLHKSLEIFSKFSGYGEIAKEVDLINQDMKMFGYDVNTALERAVDRSPSKSFKELLWGILATTRAGGDIVLYLKEKSKNFIDEYRRKLYEFSHTLTVYIEIYLTAIVLGAIFFTVLTAVVSGIGGAPGDIIVLQFFLIFVFMPVISILFIMLVKTSTPGSE